MWGRDKVIMSMFVSFGEAKHLCKHTHNTCTCSYDGKLNEAKLLGAKKGLSVGTALFFTFFLLFAVDAAAFWMGGYLISEGLSRGGDIITVSNP